MTLPAGEATSLIVLSQSAKAEPATPSVIARPSAAAVSVRIVFPFVGPRGPLAAGSSCCVFLYWLRWFRALVRADYRPPFAATRRTPRRHAPAGALRWSAMRRRLYGHLCKLACSHACIDRGGAALCHPLCTFARSTSWWTT